MRILMPGPETLSAAQDVPKPHAGRRRWWTLVAFAVLIAGVITALTASLLWRASENRHNRQTFEAASANVTATLATSLSRDADFISTIRSVMTLEPHLSPTAFETWYTTLQGHSRQLGGLGTAVIEKIPAAGIDRFLARRNADPAFGATFGKALPIATTPGGPYCVLVAGTAIVQLDAPTSKILQQNWCAPAASGRTQQVVLTKIVSAAGEFLVYPTVALGIHTMFIEAPFYRPGAPVDTASERRKAVSGWVLITFDVMDMMRSALNTNSGIEVTLSHRNPEEQWSQIASAGSVSDSHPFARTASLTIDGQWRVQVRGTTARGMSADLQGWLVFGAGVLVSGLLFLLMLVLSRSREQALGMVAEKTGQLQHQALHDALTGLPNRVLALDRAEQMLARARRSRVPMAALYVDIDGFKHVNDTFGHAAGDDFLRIVAERLRRTIREADTAGRLAGDEFVVLLDGSGLDAGPQLVAERLLEVLREPVDLGPEIARSLSVTASVGIAYGLDQSAEQLLSDADVALYVAKTSGKNRSVMFESGMQTAAQDRLRLEMDLADALEEGQLFLVYQPTFDLRSEQTIGVEALLRWQHPERGVILPDEFIPVAEDSGRIVEIGRWVLHQACAQCATWQRRGHPLTMSVNVSARQLDGDAGLVDDVRRALESNSLDPAVLTLEITETTLVRNAQATVDRLAELKELGVRIAIDDFGTGYSSLAYLRQFPVDAIKIDRSFIWGIAGSKQSEAVIQTLVRLGKTLDLETVAEGIEDEEQLAALRRQSCDQGQGFWYAHPLPVDELDRFLDAHGTEAVTS